MITPIDNQLLHACSSIGAQFELSEAVYGPPHFVGEFVDHTPAYYVFLAGLVRLTGASHIAELGTHYGGSIQAMIAGIDDELRGGAQIGTVDVTALNRDQLDTIGGLCCVQGDSLGDDAIAKMMATFDRHVDLLYVDTIHSYQQTMENTAVYANRLKPAAIVFDDIHLNSEMERFWEDVCASGAGVGHDVTERSGRGGAGLGVLVCRYPYWWPESSARVRALKRAAFSVRLRASDALSYETKARLRTLMGEPDPE